MQLKALNADIAAKEKQIEKLKGRDKQLQSVGRKHRDASRAAESELKELKKQIEEEKATAAGATVDATDKTTAAEQVRTELTGKIDTVTKERNALHAKVAALTGS